MTSPARESNSDADYVDRLLFLTMAAILCARPLISESFTHTSFSFLPDSIGGVSPAVTVRLDGVLIVAAAAAWIRRPPKKLITLVGLGYALLILAVILSVAAADSKRPALNAGANLFVLAWSAGALTRVMRARWMVHLVLAAVIAGGVTNAVKCINQRVDEFDATLETWLEQKADLATAGVDVNSPAIVNYERRLRSGEAFGYLSHPNIAAACMTTPLLLAFGLLLGVLKKPGLDLNRRSAAALIACALLVVLSIGVYLTGSMGAIASGILALILLVVLGFSYRLIAKRPRIVFSTLVGVYVAVMAFGGAYGLAKNTLPHDSLAFRWQYWRVAARAFAEHPLTGAGRENFRAAYLLHKPAESTEEVANAHCLWLTLPAELGVCGLIAGVILIGIAARRSLNTLTEVKKTAPPSPNTIMLWLTVVGALGVQACFFSMPLAAPGVLVLWAVFVAGVWTAAFLTSRTLLALIDDNAKSAAWVSVSLIAAVAAALIHNLIGFSFFTPAGLSTLMVLTAAACSWNAVPERSSKGRGAAAVISFSALALTGAYIGVVAWPTLRTQATLNTLKTRLRAASNAEQAFAILDRARTVFIAAGRRWDPTIPRWASRMSRQFSELDRTPDDQRLRWHELAEAWISEAVRSEPNSFTNRRLQATLSSSRALLTGDQTLLGEAEAIWRKRAIPLHPTNPRARIEAADLEYMLWRQTSEQTFADFARENYRAALELDAVLKPEVAHKLPVDEAERIGSRLRELIAKGN